MLPTSSGFWMYRKATCYDGVCLQLHASLCADVAYQTYEELWVRMHVSKYVSICAFAHAYEHMNFLAALACVYIYLCVCLPLWKRTYHHLLSQGVHAYAQIDAWACMPVWYYPLVHMFLTLAWEAAWKVCK